jgi:hypothetical protein
MNYESEFIARCRIWQSLMVSSIDAAVEVGRRTARPILRVRKILPRANCLLRSSQGLSGRTFGARALLDRRVADA